MNQCVKRDSSSLGSWLFVQNLLCAVSPVLELSKVYLHRNSLYKNEHKPRHGSVGMSYWTFWQERFYRRVQEMDFP